MEMIPVGGIGIAVILAHGANTSIRVQARIACAECDIGRDDADIAGFERERLAADHHVQLPFDDMGDLFLAVLVKLELRCPASSTSPSVICSPCT